MEKSSEFRHAFLFEFIRQLIIHSQHAAETIRTEKLPEIDKEDKQYETQDVRMITAIREVDAPHESRRMLMAPLAPESKAKPIVSEAPAPSALAISSYDKEIDWGKLASLLADSTLESIECPGPDKQLILTKNRVLITNSVTLTSAEIDAFINSLVRATKTQPSEGLLNIEMRAWAITAILSEFVGTRFIIQKKHYGQFG